MQEKNMDELKKCPFCGGEAYINYERIPGDRKGYWAQVLCKNCHSRSGGTWTSSYDKAEHKEVALWNRRVEE